MMKKTGTEAGSTGRASVKTLRLVVCAAVVLMALCLVAAMPVGATGTPDTSWYSSGQNEFVINTADELAGLAVLVNNGTSFKDKTVLLGADIDLSGYPNWTPIGNATHAFSGKFHGKTYGISNLYISLPENEYVGLFGNITNEINGIHLSDSFVAGYGYVGSIAGIVNGGSIVDCIVENFIVDGGGHSVGGMVGEICDDSSINACIITDGRIDGNSYVGSVVGTMSRISSCSYCIISNCTVDGDYTTGGVAGDIHSSSLNNITISSSTVTGVYDSGGLGGMLWTGGNWPGSSAKDCVMNNCTITGSGITGHLWNSEVQNCTLNSCMMSASGIADRVSTGVIDTCTLHDCTIVGESHLGGIAGTISSRSRISDSTLDNCTISGKNDMGGIAGWLYDSSINNCTLNGCNITSTQWGVSGLVHGISHSPGIYNSTHIIDCTLKNCIITGVDSVSGIAGDVTSTNIDGCVLEDCTILGEDLVAGVVSKAINTTVHACEVINCTITGIDNDVGGIGSYIYDGSSITSCLVENSVISGTNNIGGIAGRLWEDSSASSCSINSCTITSKDIHVGGGVGDLWNSDVYDATLINGTIIGKEYVGGIIGGAQGNISNCSVVAGITGTSYVGGITGSLFSGTVSNCISLVQYIDTDGTVPGRIDNSSSFGFVLQNNYAWKGMTSNGNLFTSDIGPNEKNGASVSSAEFWNNQSFFEDTLGWDFENTWKMNSGNDKYQLPVLKFQDTPVAGDATYLLAEESEPIPTPIHICHNISEWQPLDSLPADISSGTVYYYLTNDIELSRTWNITGIGTNVHLCLNGYDVTFVGETGSIVYVGEEASFTLYDCVGTGAMSGGKGRYVSGSSGYSAGGVYNDGVFTISSGSIVNCNSSGVYNHGTFTMFGGSIDNCSSNGVDNNGMFTLSGGSILNCNGRGVHSDDTFIMSGGSIENCGSWSGDSIVNCSGGGVFNFEGTFAMSGGSIENCGSWHGAGVYNNGGTFTMSSGSIVNCSAENAGGGVYHHNGIFTMSGGSIVNCSSDGDDGGGVWNWAVFTLSGGLIENCSAADSGGGVYNNAGIFTMSGGSIENCSSGNVGGGVSNNGIYHIYDGDDDNGVWEWGVFTLSGGSIINCSATHGSGVYNEGTFTISGSVDITDVCHSIYPESSIFKVNTSFIGSVTEIQIFDSYNWTSITTPNTLVVTDGAPYASQFALNETLYQGLGLVPSGNDLVIGSASPTPTPTPTPIPTPDNTSDFTLNLSPGWNFISIPKALDASNATALALFGSLDTAGNAILGYNAETQSWEQITADTVIKSLTGYWVYSTTSTAVPLTYPDVPTVPAMKQLHPGWNAVGLSADTDTSASTFFAGLNWRVALPWSCENGMYDSAIVNGGGSGNSPDRLLTLGNGCWLYVEEANVLPGLTA